MMEAKRALSSDGQADAGERQRQATEPVGRGSLHRLMQRKSTIAFLMTLPLVALIVALVAYPAGYAIYLSMLDRTMTRFVGLGNFAILFSRASFWMVVYQTCLLAVAAVVLKAIIGFVAAHFMHNIPTRGQRKWRGMLLVPWVIPPAMSILAWRLLYDPSFGAFNWILERLGMDRIFWLGEAGWARFSVILVSVWLGAPFFMIMYLASLKSVPDELYEAASIDGASWWQRTRYVTWPMTRNIIAITMLFSLIGNFAGFTIVAVLTNGGPLGSTQVLGTAAFLVGILSGNLPMGASISLFMVPILAVAATFILRGIARRGSGA
ncbi:MAG: carbohydrate ABC transporter permease [Reyranella sp.]|uniref:carbohydrate ABC transporter permease n=1 Tax=Reyranella sp. TaxID=1929291 RepID=UPI003D09CA8A